MYYFLRLIIFMTFSMKALALVEYGEPLEENPKVSQNARPKVRSVQAAPSKVKRTARGPKMLSFASTYESVKVKSGSINQNVSLVRFGAHFQSKYNLFVSSSYWVGNSDSAELNPMRSSQKGNPTILLGFNWLRFGGKTDQALIDFYGGLRVGMESSLATSRDDKIIGLETSKRFQDFALSFGFELHLTSTPDSQEEVHIGDIQKLYAKIGWTAASNIQFVLEGATYKVDEVDDEAIYRRLSRDTKFAYISPQLNLVLSPAVILNLGASFRTRKSDQMAALLGARLWDASASYGNSLFAGLQFAI